MEYGRGIKRKRKRYSTVSLQCLEQKKLGTAAAIPVSTPSGRGTGKDAAIAQGSCSLSPAISWEERTCNQLLERQTQVKQNNKVCSTALDAEIDELLFSPEVGAVTCEDVSEDIVGGVMKNEGVLVDEVIDECVIGESRVVDEGLEVLLDLNPEDLSFSLDSSTLVHRPPTEPCCVAVCGLDTTSLGPTNTSVKGEELVRGDGIEEELLDDQAVMVPRRPVGWSVDTIPESPVTSPIIPHARFSSSSSPEMNEILLLRTPSPTLIRTASTPFKTPHVAHIAETEHVDYPINTFYGLPVMVQNLLKNHRGITELYGWQDDCLHLRSVHDGCNLIYSLPTSGGKTLVAELIIFRQLLVFSKNVLFILPFVSIVQEKLHDALPEFSSLSHSKHVRELLPFANALDFVVEEYAAHKGALPPRKRRKKNVVYIATIEKASTLTNSLIELQRISELGLCIVDELHMVGDGTQRGATLEACIAKIQLATERTTQIVGMSATLSNISELASFLRAKVYSSDFRPVELREYVKLGRSVYSVCVEGLSKTVMFHPDRQISDSLSSSPSFCQQQLDPDHLCSLVMEVLPHGSCLIFCPTKKNCQNVAILLSNGLPNSVKCFGGKFVEARQALLQLLVIEASGVCPILRQTIPCGVAYHHSGLTSDERKVIEEAYLDGTLSVLACTSTLAAGVNLPAKRVILRSPFIGNHLLRRSQYQQMVGRAGRSGMCASGESILILQDSDRAQVSELLSGPCERCCSSLLADDLTALLSLILTLIGLKLVRGFHQLWSFLSYTLLYVQIDSGLLKEHCHQAVERLVSLGYLSLEDGEGPDDSTFSVTSLGRATYKGSLPVKIAHVLFRDLVQATKHLVLTSDLHLLYLATHPDLGNLEYVQPNWMVYFKLLTGLGEDEMHVAELVGVEPGTLSRKATGTAEKMSPSLTGTYLRFYLSLMLHCLLQTSNVDAVWRVAHTFSCSRGFLQSLLNSASSFISCLIRFTQEIPELWSLNLLLPAVGMKLSCSSRLDLLPLLQISGIKLGRARQLLSVGICTPQSLAAADPHTLCLDMDHLYHKQARCLVTAAKAFLSEQAEALLEEAEELMTLLPNIVSTRPSAPPEIKS